MVHVVSWHLERPTHGRIGLVAVSWRPGGRHVHGASAELGELASWAVDSLTRSVHVGSVSWRSEGLTRGLGLGGEFGRALVGRDCLAVSWRFRAPTHRWQIEAEGIGPMSALGGRLVGSGGPGLD